MQKNKNTKSRAVDLLIILLCFAGAGVSGFAFWREYNRTLVKLNEQPVGNIVFKNRTAHRKIENRAAWDRLKQESPIYNGDTIRTAEASEAFITFEDQITKVNLYENTLIQIFYDARGARIDFSGGNVDVASGGGSVFVSSGSSLVEVGSGSRVTLNRGGEGFSLSVTEGQARLDDGTELDSGGMLSFLSDGTLDTAPAVTVTSFGPFARILASPEGTASALFTWNSVNFDADTRVILEIARDRGFSSVSQTREISGASSAAVTLETGEYWWRAYPTRGAGGGIPERGSDSGRIEAFPFALISPVSPSPSQEFVFSGETSIPFSWTAAEGADAYVLEVSASSNMNNPAVSRLVRETAVTEAGLEPGRWYWRVTPVFPEQVIGTAVPSETDVFSIARGAPSAPALTIPAQDGVLGLDRPRMAWKYDPGVVFWTLEVADNPQMSNPLLQRDSDSNFSSPPAGIFRRDSVYFWRVTARGAGDLSASSPVRSFTTVDHTYRHRAVFPPDNYFTGADELARIRFTYQSNAPYQNYFQISSQSDFSSLEINNPVEAEGGSVSALEPGIWYWRIHADGESGPVSTAPRRLNVASVSEAPRIRVSDSLSQGTALVLDWEPLYFASYQVSVYSAEDRENSIERRITTTSSAAFSTASLEPGDYIVSVEGFNPESAISAWSAGVPAEARLTVVPAPEITILPAAVVVPLPEPEPVVVVVPEPEPEPVAAVIPEPEPVAPVIPEPEPVVAVVPEPVPVVAVAPEPVQPPARPDPAFSWASRPVPGSFPPDGYILSAEQLADAGSVNFTWEGGGRNYRFTLYRTNGEVVVPSSVVDAPSFTMRNPGSLEPGEYVWEVVEQDGRGRPGEPTAARFTVRAGPPILRTLSTNNPGVLYGNP